MIHQVLTVLGAAMIIGALLLRLRARPADRLKFWRATSVEQALSE